MDWTTREMVLAAIGWGCIVAMAIGVAVLCTSCGAAQYGAKLEACRTNARTCAEYVACRTDVETEYGHTWLAHCADRGAP